MRGLKKCIIVVVSFTIEFFDISIRFFFMLFSFVYLVKIDFFVRVYYKHLIAMCLKLR